MKCLSGIHQPNEGELLVDGNVLAIPDVRAAEAQGIAFIHQELNLAENLNIGANVFLGREPTFVRTVLRSKGNIATHLASCLRIWSSICRRRFLCRIYRSVIGRWWKLPRPLSQEARVLIMDEPTSSLSLHETRILLRLVRKLRAEGMCIVFISHRMAEVEEIADRVLVLRDGRNSGELQAGEIERDRIVKLMVGRELALHDKVAAEPGKVVLEVDNLRVSRFPDISVNFELRAGEVVGMAGLVGAGRTEVARAIFGIDRPIAGTVKVDGASVVIRNPSDAVRAGIALVPEDRKAQGAVLELAIRDNVAMVGLERWQRAGFVKDNEVDEQAEQAKEALRIQTPDTRQLVAMLSGGNQQKVVLAKWMPLKPKIFLLDEPTRGSMWDQRLKFTK